MSEPFDFDEDEVIQRLTDCDWNYGDRDPAALEELSRRIAAVGRTQDKFLTCSELVDGVTFRLPNVAGGEPFQIREWTGLNRAIIGSFLGRIVLDSYRQGEFFASALIVLSERSGRNQPCEGFWTLAQEVGLLRSNADEDAKLLFWFEHIRLAREWHRAHPVAEYASPRTVPPGGRKPAGDPEPPVVPPPVAVKPNPPPPPESPALEMLPTAKQYREVLTRLRAELPDAHVRLLQAHYRFPRHTATATALAQAVGYENYRAVNLQYGLLGERLRQALGFRAEGQASYAIASFVHPGGEGNSEWLLVMHTALVQALEETGWVTPQRQGESALFYIYRPDCGNRGPLPIGCRPFSTEEVPIVTRDKSILLATGKRLFLIAAIGTPPAYFLWRCFTVESTKEEGGAYIASGPGWMLMPPQQLEGPDFDALKNACASNLHRFPLPFLVHLDLDAVKGRCTALADQYRSPAVTPEVEGFATRLIKLTGEDGDTYYFRGLARLELGREEGAKADLMEALAHTTRFPDEAKERLRDLAEELGETGILASQELVETEKEQLVNARRGQGRFKENLQRVEKGCRISGIADPRFLTASHIKPWRDSNNAERLDGENGLLLTPNIDRLFDRGFISFDDDGTLLLSPVVDKPSLRKLGVPVDEPTNVGVFTAKQREYLSFHRRHVFVETATLK